ncbi:MAG: DNA primase, partial [Armatimonadetes bacterium]|nr:DNA primase [Armatimonadota bacterium]
MALDSTTEEIRRRADIVEVASQSLSLVPAGNGRMKACCPCHDEKTPSFYISRDKCFYNCFGCGASGDVYKFVQAMENTDFVGARKILGSRYNVEIKSRREMTPEQKEEVSER